MPSELDWRLLRDLLDLRNRFHSAVEQALAGQVRPAVASPLFEPSLDVYEDEDEVVVEVELPGVKAEHIDLQLQGDTLILSGSFPSDLHPQGTLHRSERPRGRFHRAVPLPAEVLADPAASLADGVLVVRLKKAGGNRRIVPIATEEL
jgi:HSP20 family protein